MNYKSYQANHFGESVDIYNIDGDLVYQEIKPVGVEFRPSEYRGMPMFKFFVDKNGSTLELPVNSDLRLSSENVITTEDTV